MAIYTTVALLAEGVDRNRRSSRRSSASPVALLAEGVDRNKCRCTVKTLSKRRPPRGGRG